MLLLIYLFLMNKALNFVKKSLKYCLFGSTVLTIGGYGYLQYINTILGPINIDKQTALDYYKEQYKMEEKEATKTYNWVIFHVSLARIMSFRTYKYRCEQLNAKIVDHTLDNYNKYGVLEQIAEGQKKRVSGVTFNKIVDIRKLNADNIELRQYIIKQIRQLQKEMHSNLILAIPQQSVDKVTRIHEYICEAGKAFRDGQILHYLSKLPQIQRKNTGDYLHKILFI